MYKRGLNTKIHLRGMRKVIAERMKRSIDENAQTVHRISVRMDEAARIRTTFEIHPVVKLTLSYDHRIVDGAPAARFLSRVKEYLENPYLML